MANAMSMPIQVLHPRKLPAWSISAQRTAVGVAGDYKPSMAMMPDGELVMVGLYMERRQDGTMREWTPLWRSRDGGQTWSPRQVFTDVIGREQWLTATTDGTLFMTSHLLIEDVNNTDKLVHSYLHRSTDGGRTWERMKVLLKGKQRRGEALGQYNGGHTSRNVVEMPDGTLLLGVSIHYSSVAYLWRSSDRGKTWQPGSPVSIGDYRGRPYDNADGFFAEDFTFAAHSGKLLHWIRCGPPSPMYPMDDGRAVPSGDDQGDRTIMCESLDGGKTWTNLRDFSDYGSMYVRVIRLRDGRLLMTYTRRSLIYPIGLRAALSYDDGETWDLDNDIIIIEGKTPWGAASGGGFGNTLQLPDDSLISCYTYRGEDGQTHLETVKWRLPVSDVYPYSLEKKIAQLKEPRRLEMICDWSARSRVKVEPYDTYQTELPQPHVRITRVKTKIGGDTFLAKVQFLSQAEANTPCTGLTFTNLPVQDWSDYRAAAIKLHNPTDQPQDIALWCWPLERNEQIYVRVQTYQPGETAVIALGVEEMLRELPSATTACNIGLLAQQPRTRRTFLAGPLYLIR